MPPPASNLRFAAFEVPEILNGPLTITAGAIAGWLGLERL